MNILKEHQNTLFIVSYKDLKTNKVISLKVGSIQDSTLGIGFLHISNFIFENSSPLINPIDEELKIRFENTKALHLSIYSIISIEEVGKDHQGLSISKNRSNLIFLPQNND